MIAGMTLIIAGAIILVYGLLRLREEVLEKHPKQKFFVDLFSMLGVVLVIVLVLFVRVLLGYDQILMGVVIGILIIVAALAVLKAVDVLGVKAAKKTKKKKK